MPMQLDGQGDPRFAHKVSNNFDTTNLWLKINSTGEEWLQVGLSPGLTIGRTTLLQSLRSNGTMHMVLALQMDHGWKRCLCCAGEDLPGKTCPNLG